MFFVVFFLRGELGGRVGGEGEGVNDCDEVLIFCLFVDFKNSKAVWIAKE